MEKLQNTENKIEDISNESEEKYQKYTPEKILDTKTSNDKKNAENFLLKEMGAKEYFNNKSYEIKKGDGFLKIFQNLLGYDITKNIDGELLVQISKILDENFIDKNGKKIQIGDLVKISNNSILISDKKGIIKFESKIQILSNDIKYIDINTYEGGKYKNIKNDIGNLGVAKIDSTYVNHNINYKIGKTEKDNKNKKDTYEIWSERADGVLTIVGVVAGGAVLIFGGAPVAAAIGISYATISTALMVVSIAKVIIDAGYEARKNGSVSGGDYAKGGMNIAGNIIGYAIDKKTMGAGSIIMKTINSKNIIIKSAGLLIDEGSDSIGGSLKRIVNN